MLPLFGVCVELTSTAHVLSQCEHVFRQSALGPYEKCSRSACTLESEVEAYVKAQWELIAGVVVGKALRSLLILDIRHSQGSL